MAPFNIARAELNSALKQHTVRNALLPCDEGGCVLIKKNHRKTVSQVMTRDEVRRLISHTASG